MGRASSRKRSREDRMAAAAEQQADALINANLAAGREVPYTALLITGRAVRVRVVRDTHWLEVQLAGPQGNEQSPTSNRSFMVAFTSKASAERTGGSLLDVLREWERDGQINTDARYNQIVRAWAEAVKQKIEQTNSELLATAESKVQHARVPAVPSWRRLFGLDKQDKHTKESE